MRIINYRINLQILRSNNNNFLINKIIRYNFLINNFHNSHNFHKINLIIKII